MQIRVRCKRVIMKIHRGGDNKTKQFSKSFFRSNGLRKFLYATHSLKALPADNKAEFENFRLRAAWFFKHIVFHIILITDLHQIFQSRLSSQIFDMLFTSTRNFKMLTI